MRSAHNALTTLPITIRRSFPNLPELDTGQTIFISKPASSPRDTLPLEASPNFQMRMKVS